MSDRRTDVLSDANEPRYQVLFEIASGGMGRVAVARVRGTASFQRLVALKTIHPFLADDPRFQSMFFEEARLAAGIHHPNVVPVLDLGRQDNTFFLAMEYVPGEPLSTVLNDCFRDGVSVPLGVALRWIADACAGLHAAHELRDPLGRPLSLVHRDVSPSNLLVTEYGSCKLTDFGIAKALSTRDHTTAGALKGKMGYLSPEQVRGEKPDRRSDIFSLGVILFEVTTMRKLFAGPGSVKVLEAIAMADVPDPRTIVPDYPDELAQVIRTALAQDRRQRFATAEAMGSAVERAARNLPNAMVAADVSAWVRERLGDRFEARRRKCADALRALDGEEAIAEPPTSPSARPIDAQSLSGAAPKPIASAPVSRPPSIPRVPAPTPSLTDPQSAPMRAITPAKANATVTPAQPIATVTPAKPIASTAPPPVPANEHIARQSDPSLTPAIGREVTELFVAEPTVQAPAPVAPPVPVAAAIAPPNAPTAPFPVSTASADPSHTPTPFAVERELTPHAWNEIDDPYGAADAKRKRIRTRAMLAAGGVAVVIALAFVFSHSSGSSSTTSDAARSAAAPPAVVSAPAPTVNPLLTPAPPQTPSTAAVTPNATAPGATTVTSAAALARTRTTPARARSIRRTVPPRHRDGSYRPDNP